MMTIDNYVAIKQREEENSYGNPYDPNDNRMADIHGQGFSSGLSHGLDIAMNFGNWINSNPNIEKCDRGFRYKGVHPYHADQLLQIYLTEINKK